MDHERWCKDNLFPICHKQRIVFLLQYHGASLIFPPTVNYASFLKQVLGELPEQCVLCIIYGIPIYWLANLSPQPEHFFLNLLLLMLGTCCARTMALWISALLPTMQISAFFGNVLYTTFFLSGGFLISLQNLWTGELNIADADRSYIWGGGG